MELHCLHQHNKDIMATWLWICQILATFYNQVVQLGMVQWCWLLCSAFMTYYNLFGHPPCSKLLPVNHQLMGMWTSKPTVVQKLMSLGIPVWFIHPSQIVSLKIHVAQLIYMLSTHAICHNKLPGGCPLYQGLVGANHLEATLASPTYADISCIPTAKMSDPNNYCARSLNHPHTYGD